MSDSVIAESSMFWTLVIEPTRFPGFFCEPVTRIFESGPEPCSRPDHMWRCCFTETMINGQVTTDIHVDRIHVKDSTLRKSFLQSASSLESVLLGSVAVQLDSPQYPQHPQHQQSCSGYEDQGNHERPPKSYYKTIALYTPKKLGPITSMNLGGGAIAVQLEAGTILHRGKYQLECVFSEETSTNHIPSPASCHRILDSLFHEVVATSLPNPQTANIWFEFLTQASNESYTNLSSHPSGRHVTAVAAHEEVLRQHPKIAEWIDRERATQEQARRYQLQEEWKTHLQERSRPSTYPTLTLLPPSEQSSRYGYSSSEIEGQTVDQGQRPQRRSVTGRDHPCFDSQRQSSSFTSAGDKAPTECPLDCKDSDHELQDQSQSWRLRATQQQQQERKQPAENVEAQTSSDSLPQLRHRRQHPPGSAVHLDQQENRRQPQQQQRQSDRSSSRHLPSDEAVLPALTIVVTDITVGTFQTMLQFLYTNQIGISEEQEFQIDVHWNDDPEDHHRVISPNPQSREGLESVTLPDPLAPPTHYPGLSFSHRVITDQELYPGLGTGDGSEKRGFNFRFSGASMCGSTHSSSSVLPSWIPCSRRNQPSYSGAGSSSLSGGGGCNIHRSSSDNGSGDGGISNIPVYRPSCSFENLLMVAWRFQLKDLQALCLKAIEYHCQMMAIHNCFDDIKSDLQLAWGEQVVCSFLRLYNSPRIRINGQGLTIDTSEEVIKSSTPDEERRTENTFSQEGERVAEASSSGATAVADEIQSEQRQTLVESEATKPLEVGDEFNVLREQMFVTSPTIHRSLDTQPDISTITQSGILQRRTGSPVQGPCQRPQDRVQPFQGQQRDRQRHGAASSSLLATSDRQLQQQRRLQAEGQTSSRRVTEPSGVTRAQVKSQLLQKMAHAETRDELSSADPSGCNTTGAQNYTFTEQWERPRQGFFESPMFEHEILELCQQIRSQYLRMRDILDE